MKFATLPKLQPGDSVAIVSPSFVAPAVFPMEYELGLSRLRDQFGLKPVEMPHTKNMGASHKEKMSDLIQAFSDSSYKAVISTLGGDHQVEYVHKLPVEPFRNNPKPFFGYSDNTHLSNFLFLNGVPSFYGGAIYTEFAMQGAMDLMTVKFINAALFSCQPMLLEASSEFNDEDLPWGVPENLERRRRYQPNEGWYWDGDGTARGYTWGGCVESLDEILRHGHPMPTLSDFEEIVLILETSEELPSASYVRRVLRALGQRGILAKVQGVIVGRPKAWSLESQVSDELKTEYKRAQREVVLRTIRAYNPSIPVVQNTDFGHTAPTCVMPYGALIQIRSEDRSICVSY